MKYPHLFGIRHLSPNASYSLKKFLNKINPKAILIEGPADANELIKEFNNQKIKPPIAILSYTLELPVKTLIWPLAEYSPEFVAIKWALDSNAYLEFIDLPSSIFISFNDYLGKIKNYNLEEEFIDNYQRIAKIAGYDDFDEYWENFFENNINEDAFHMQALTFGKEIRSLDMEISPDNKVRESFMRMRIKETLKKYKPEEIVVITGAYHSNALNHESEAMTLDELEKLPKSNTKLTLMPYSYYRLSTKSGYGAGNNAPEYYEMKYQALEGNELENNMLIYFSKLAFYLRANGYYRSTAEVIECVRLAKELAILRNNTIPTLQDLKDAAITCLGYGEKSLLLRAFMAIEIGTKIGSLPEGLSQTSIQDDFNRELTRLKLTKYKTAVWQELSLDLRENRLVKNEELSFLDLARSRFLHRLRILKISFQRFTEINQDLATWKEAWALQWSAESEIELVEAILKGETIEQAIGFEFNSVLETASTIKEIGIVIKESLLCGMPEVMLMAKNRLKEMVTFTNSFIDIAIACYDIYKSLKLSILRKINMDSFIPLLESMYVQATTTLINSANCNKDAAISMMQSIHYINEICNEYYKSLDESLWINALVILSEKDNLNQTLSGYATSILLERGLIDDQALEILITKRLSIGIPADLGASWFEGLISRNRYVIVSKLSLWRIVNDYISSLDNEEYLKALVFLRRAFGGFSIQEKRIVCENLAEIWQVSKDDVENLITEELNENERKKLESLNDFDFDF